VEEAIIGATNPTPTLTLIFTHHLITPYQPPQDAKFYDYRGTTRFSQRPAMISNILIHPSSDSLADNAFELECMTILSLVMEDRLAKNSRYIGV